MGSLGFTTAPSGTSSLMKYLRRIHKLQLVSLMFERCELEHVNPMQTYMKMTRLTARSVFLWSSNALVFV
jgi:hypothetical protein